ncbi:hypothetical protein [Natronorarus salvus]|uniref:hypothetical protein n=1 Tax=Natronorarus salvus TaxID=3117733 RepID=UPI002F269D62
MSQKTHTNPTGESIDACELTTSERNRYFHGKLMTARDMAAEQTYHRRLFTRRSRHVTGYGVVDGLEAEVERVDDGLAVTVEPGYAIDCCGRPVVVSKETTVRIGTEEFPGSDRLGLFIEYAECVTESVPIPGSEDACERECAYNRVIETFDLRVEGVESDDRPAKPVPPVDFPDRDGFGVDEDGTERAEELRTEIDEILERRERLLEEGDEERAEELRHRAEELERDLESLEESGETEGGTTVDGIDRYHPELTRIARTWDTGAEFPVGCVPNGTHSVYLGSFSQPSEETETVDVAFRPRVYTNDMLYSAITGHTTDFGNPHDVTAGQTGALISVKGVENPGGDVDLASPDGNVSFTTDPDDVGEHTVGLSVPGLADVDDGLQAHLGDTDNPHEVTAAQTGALESVAGVGGDDDGNLDLASPDETVSITRGDDAGGDHTVGLSVTGLAELEERVSELEARHRRDIERITDRLIRVEHYVMERSVWGMCSSFGVVFRRFDNQQTAARVIRAALEFLGRHDAGERIQPEEYFDYLVGVLELQQQLLAELERNAGPQPRVQVALEELGNAIERRDEENVLPAAAAQNKARKLFECVHPLVIE